MQKKIHQLLNQEIINKSKYLSFKANEPIIQTDESLQYLYYIIQGKAKIYQYTENGKEMFIHFLSSDDWIGELTFLNIEKETKNVISIGETTVLAIPKKIVFEELLTDLDFLLEMNRFIGKKLLDRTQHFVKNQGYDLKYRLATLLVELSHDDLYSEKHTNIVNYLGVSYRHLLQTFKDFQEENLIKKIDQSTYRINRNAIDKYYIHSKL
ncbi:TPA: cyclic nucleotide-binding domain-containing protein [Streptococcus agalactiae]|nr:cyclic nucleotide-binding domain-containing protein [Streptococcus agalactiae]